ncbi:MAG: UDP-N-acetylmuramoyl-L-alanyl-D-glutamate--2,6-diaminopimelate ligase [Alphaproteobacteria bacterium]|nr:UDP-N-acetylmuramoyl-L-alanyl-D-glutamate--2,6-diaminopimelate ligase [Alphaproteobacteria bacterium]
MTSTHLPELLAQTEAAGKAPDNRTITGITADSREVLPGYLFAAIPGTKHDGRLYIADALAKGAAALLVPPATDMPKGADNSAAVIVVQEPRRALSRIAANFYPQMPSIIAAVTGTNGKTSTAQFARQVWAALGREAASIGTLGIISKHWTHVGSLTTPDAITLHKTLSQLAANGVTHLAMEASSHGLHHSRLDTVPVGIAGFTNLTHDHLDFHGTMEAYFAAKSRLFDQILVPGGVAVLNADTPEGRVLAERVRKSGRKAMMYGKTGKELKLNALIPLGHGQRLVCDVMGKPCEVTLPVAGQFQAWNALCALGMVIASGESDVLAATHALETITSVRGRLELVGTHASGANIFVDYAHTPDALETVLNALRPHVGEKQGGKLALVFGCGGDRDRTKRPAMGCIASKLADRAIVTDDNPRSEDPAAIRKEIIAGCTQGANLAEIGDRSRAIHQAVGALNKGDILIIAGKGHESGQIVGDKILPFDDAAVVQAALRKGAA